MLVKTRREGGTISRKTPFIGYSAPSGARMTILSAPPGLRSISQTGLVKVFGPHHFASCFGSVHALNTSSRGALKTRVMVSSRSANVFLSALLVTGCSYWGYFLRARFFSFVRRLLFSEHLQVGEAGLEVLADHAVHIEKDVHNL